MELKMERDFMGLAVKQENSDETIDAVPVRSLPMQWSFAKKGSSPHLLSFYGVQEDKPKTGFHSLTSTEAFDSAKKNIVSEKQGGVCYTMTTYPTNTIHRPVINQNLGQNLIGSVPMTNPISTMPSNSPVVGTTDLRNASKIPGAPAQLTIFYNGSVCVYNNISPEKAQAIMLLAGNGPPMTPSATPSPTPLQASIPRSNVLDGFAVSQHYGTTPCHLPSPVPLNSISVSQSVSRSGGNNNTNVAKPAGLLFSSSNIAEPLKAVNSFGSISTSFLSSDTVPQFRRKSLARFLEKRKERVISGSPYGDKQTPDCPVTATN